MTDEMLAQEQPIVKTVVRDDTLMQVATTVTLGLTGGMMKSNPEQGDYCITIDSAWVNLSTGRFEDPASEQFRIGDLLADYPEYLPVYTAFRYLIIKKMRGDLPPKEPIAAAPVEEQP